MLSVLHDVHVLRVEHDAQRRWLIVIWRPRQDACTSRHGCAVILDCVRRHRCRRILNDSRAVCSFWAEAAESIGTYFAAELVAQGIERAAWLNGVSIYDQLSTRQTMAYVTQPLARVFNDYQEAVHWLASD